MTIEELRQRKARLWAEYLELEKPLEVKRAEWNAARQRLEDAELREKVREELRAELAQKPEAA